MSEVAPDKKETKTETTSEKKEPKTIKLNDIVEFSLKNRYNASKFFAYFKNKVPKFDKSFKRGFLNNLTEDKIFHDGDDEKDVYLPYAEMKELSAFIGPVAIVAFLETLVIFRDSILEDQNKKIAMLNFQRHVTMRNCELIAQHITEKYGEEVSKEIVTKAKEEVEAEIKAKEEEYKKKLEAEKAAQEITELPKVEEPEDNKN